MKLINLLLTCQKSRRIGLKNVISLKKKNQFYNVGLQKTNVHWDRFREDTLIFSNVLQVHRFLQLP